MKSAASLPRRLFLFFLGSIVIGLTCLGCGKKAEVPASVVTWPELMHFDEVLREAKSLVAESRTREILEKRVALLNAGWAVAPASAPDAPEWHRSQSLGKKRPLRVMYSRYSPPKTAVR